MIQFPVSPASQITVTACSSEDYFNIMLVGEPKTGKTSVLHSFLTSSFQSNIPKFRHSIPKVNVKTEVGSIDLKLWDSDGIEDQTSICDLVLQNSDGIILIYSVTSKESFNELSSWMNLFQLCRRDISIILVGNKCDLSEDRLISYKEGEKFAIQNKLDFFLEVSAQTGNGIYQMMEILAKSLMKKKNKDTKK